jgi:nitroreductase
MEVYETVRTVLAVRAFQPKPVPPDVIQRILEAGRLTGSSKNGQPWQFIVVENRDTLNQLGAMMRYGRYIAEAPLAIIVVIERSEYAVSDASRAIQSMILAAWSEGVGSNWVGFYGMPEGRSLLGIPDALDMLAMIPFGYPAKTIGKGKKNRKALSEIVHRERFGQPFE